ENLTTTGLVITGNSSRRDGGGIASSGSLTLISSTISGNAAARTGGGVFSAGPYTTLQSSQINYNSAQDGGGIASNAASNYLTIADSTLKGNAASNNAGGILAANGTTRIAASTI